MIDGLFEHPWSELSHAYGPAEDVPDLLLALERGEGQALHELYSCTLHQGTVYEATVPVVRCLLRLLGPDLQDPAGVLCFLGAAGRSRDSRGGGRAAVLSGIQGALAEGAATLLRVAAIGSPEVRAAAGFALGGCTGLGPEVATTVCGLASQEPEPIPRASLILALAALGAADLSERLTGFVRRDRAPVVRVAAALGVLRTEPDPVALEPAFRILVESFPAAREDYARLPWCERDALDQLSHDLEERHELAVRLLEHLLRSHDHETVRLAIWAAREMVLEWRTAPAALVPALADLLQAADEDSRGAAAEAIALSGTAAALATEPLLRALRDDEAPEKVRRHALAALAHMHHPRAAEEVRELLEAGQPDAVPEPAWRGLGQAFLPALPALLRCLRDLPHQRSFDALEAIVGCGPAGRDAVPLLLELLQEGGWALPVTIALGRLGPSARAAIPALLPQLSDPYPHQRLNAAQALLRIDPERGEWRPVLESALLDKDWRVVSHAVRALEDAGPRAGFARQRLLELLGDERLLFAAALALWRVDRDPASVLERIRQALPSRAAVECLAEMGSAASAVLPELERIATSPRRLLGGAEHSLAWEDDALARSAREAIAAIRAGAARG